ncbi:hypothetical protein KBY28_16620 [Ruegeria pomeroyi]|uniref:hypothetical protein n=1 Tax=Ruegeria pomeroyi TaxID=89184 RepID=UPI001F1BB924|nr:hypothetical protein [Ruegeria pomeroyi]MCE8510077.1 hypothetical protein [Ruegeria pomeroyi]
MFRSIREKVIVSVISAVLLASLYALWGTIKELRYGFGVPNGAVIAYDLPEGCPPGWSNLGNKWKGRMIVAAIEDANDTYGFGKSSGRATHTLTLAELPGHRHVGVTSSANAVPFLRIVAPNGLGYLENHMPGWSSGGNIADISNTLPPASAHTHNFATDLGEGLEGREHNNMPPYVALYYCRKGA